jgi:hypothetical protein
VKRIWIIAAALFVVLGGVVFLFVWGYLGSLIGGGTDHPPCETLPSHTEVRRAIKEHSPNRSQPPATVCKSWWQPRAMTPMPQYSRCR